MDKVNDFSKDSDIIGWLNNHNASSEYIDYCLKFRNSSSVAGWIRNWEAGFTDFGGHFGTALFDGDMEKAVGYADMENTANLKTMGYETFVVNSPYKSHETLANEVKANESIENWWGNLSDVGQEQVLLASGVDVRHKGLSWNNLGQENHKLIIQEYGSNPSQWNESKAKEVGQVGGETWSEELEDWVNSVFEPTDNYDLEYIKKEGRAYGITDSDNAWQDFWDDWGRMDEMEKSMFGESKSKEAGGGTGKFSWESKYFTILGYDLQSLSYNRLDDLEYEVTHILDEMESDRGGFGRGMNYSSDPLDNEDLRFLDEAEDAMEKMTDDIVRILDQRDKDPNYPISRGGASNYGESKAKEEHLDNIHWEEARDSGLPIIDKGRYYECDGKMVNWDGQEAWKAENFLKNNSIKGDESKANEDEGEFFRGMEDPKEILAYHKTGEWKSLSESELFDYVMGLEAVRQYNIAEISDSMYWKLIDATGEVDGFGGRNNDSSFMDYVAGDLWESKANEASWDESKMWWDSLSISERENQEYTHNILPEEAHLNFDELDEYAKDSVQQAYMEMVVKTQTGMDQIEYDDVMDQVVPWDYDNKSGKDFYDNFDGRFNNPNTHKTDDPSYWETVGESKAKEAKCPDCLNGWRRDVPPYGDDEECWTCDGTGTVDSKSDEEYDPVQDEIENMFTTTPSGYTQKGIKKAMKDEDFDSLDESKASEDWERDYNELMEDGNGDNPNDKEDAKFIIDEINNELDSSDGDYDRTSFGDPNFPEIVIDKLKRRFGIGESKAKEQFEKDPDILKDLWLERDEEPYGNVYTVEEIATRYGVSVDYVRDVMGRNDVNESMHDESALWYDTIPKRKRNKAVGKYSDVDTGLDYGFQLEDGRDLIDAHYTDSFLAKQLDVDKRDARLNYTDDAYGSMFD